MMKTIAAMPMTSARSRRTAYVFMRSRTSRSRIPDKRSRSSESCNVGTPCSRGPGAIAASASALPPSATAMLSARFGRLGNFDSSSALHVSPHLFRLRRSDHAGNIQRRHQPHGADGDLRVLFDGVIVQDVDFEAAAAEIDDAARRRFGSHHCDRGFASKARFFVRCRSLRVRLQPFVLISRTKASRLRASREALVATAR